MLDIFQQYIPLGHNMPGLKLKKITFQQKLNMFTVSCLFKVGSSLTIAVWNSLAEKVRSIYTANTRLTAWQGGKYLQQAIYSKCKFQGKTNNMKQANPVQAL